MATVLGVRSFGRELHRISAHTHTPQAQPKGLGQPCRASQASEANGQLHPHRQLELSLQTVGRPCALMMMQIPVVLLQGKGVGLAPSLGILRPNSRQRNCLPISVFCFRGSRQRNRRPPVLITCASPCFTPPPFRPAISLSPRGLGASTNSKNSILPTRRQTHTLYLHAGMWGTALLCRACIRHVGKSSMAAAAIRRSSSNSRAGLLPRGSPFSSGLILLLLRRMPSPWQANTPTLHQYFGRESNDDKGLA